MFRSENHPQYLLTWSGLGLVCVGALRFRIFEVKRGEHGRCMACICMYMQAVAHYQ